MLRGDVMPRLASLQAEIASQPGQYLSILACQSKVELAQLSLDLAESMRRRRIVEFADGKISIWLGISLDTDGNREFVVDPTSMNAAADLETIRASLDAVASAFGTAESRAGAALELVSRLEFRGEDYCRRGHTAFTSVYLEMQTTTLKQSAADGGKGPCGRA